MEATTEVRKKKIVPFVPLSNDFMHKIFIPIQNLVNLPINLDNQPVKCDIIQ